MWIASEHGPLDRWFFTYETHETRWFSITHRKKKQRVESVLLVACFDGGIYILRCRLVMCGLFLVHDPSRHMSLTHRNCQEVWVPGSVVCVQRPAFRFVFHPGRGSGRS
jgi:hypothetical protein